MATKAKASGKTASKTGNKTSTKPGAHAEAKTGTAEATSKDTSNRAAEETSRRAAPDKTDPKDIAKHQGEREDQGSKPEHQTAQAKLQQGGEKPGRARGDAAFTEGEEGLRKQTDLTEAQRNAGDRPFDSDDREEGSTRNLSKPEGEGGEDEEGDEGDLATEIEQLKEEGLIATPAVSGRRGDENEDLRTLTLGPTLLPIEFNESGELNLPDDAELWYRHDKETILKVERFTPGDRPGTLHLDCGHHRRGNPASASPSTFNIGGLKPNVRPDETGREEGAFHIRRKPQDTSRGVATEQRI